MTSIVTAAAVYVGAQSPNVSLSADFNPQLRFSDDGRTMFRPYDDEGRFSRIRLGITLENGWVAKLFQKIGRIDNDPDKSGTEEVYIERPGDWRVGKFYIPFGSGDLLRETGLGLKIDTFLAFADLPIAVAYVDNGPRRQQGFVARIGDNIGLSVAIGKHFGINATAFTQLRPPENSPGVGHGYGQALGVDIWRRWSGFTFRAEFIRLRDGSTAEDLNQDIVDLYLAYQFPYGPLIEGEAAIEVWSGKPSFRAAAQIPTVDKVFLVPSVRRYGNGEWTYGLSVRVRL